MIQNKSIMTSYIITSPYFRHIPIYVTFDLTMDHLTDVEKNVLLMHVLSVNDDASLDKASRMLETKYVLISKIDNEIWCRGVVKDGDKTSLEIVWLDLEANVKITHLRSQWNMWTMNVIILAFAYTNMQSINTL